MKLVAAYFRSLNPQLPRSVQTLQAGALANAFGNGLAYPFLFIYLHNVRGIGLGTAGLIVGTNAAVGLVAGPLSGAVIDRVGGRVTLAGALVLMAVGYGAYPFVLEPWHGFVASAVAGAGNGAFWPSQSTLINGLTPREHRQSAFAMQRVMMNLGIGLGGMTGGLIATTSNPDTFKLLFLLDAATFLVFAGVLPLVPEPYRPRGAERAAGTYRVVLRDRVFVRVLLLNFVLITAGMAQIEVLPAYAKNEAGVTERGIGLIFLVNTLLIVFAQLPVAKLQEGRRRARALALVGVVWAVSWLAMPLVGIYASGVTAVVSLAVIVAVFGIGECLHGAVQAPLVADLADHRVIGRYMAASAFSWSVGFALGPAVGGQLLAASPHALWAVVAAVLLAAGAGALTLDRALPAHARRTPRAAGRSGAPPAPVPTADLPVGEPPARGVPAEG